MCSQIFLFFFGFVIPLFLSAFIGIALLSDHPYAAMLYHLYVNKIFLSGLLLFVILFLAVDYVLPEIRVVRKYLLAGVVSLALVGILYQPFLWQPFHIFDAEEYVHLQALQTAQTELTNILGREPSSSDLETFLSHSKNNEGKLHGARASEIPIIVRTLTPFLKIGGATTIFWKPVDDRSIAVRVIVLGIIAAMLFSFYKVNRPVNAYIDKLLILFFLFCVLDILHIYALLNSNSHEMFQQIFIAGQYVTVANFVIMVYAFDLKRRFVRSVTGKFYEQSLHDAPERITRLRDELDTLILNSFFNNQSPTKLAGLFSKLNQKPEDGRNP